MSLPPTGQPTNQVPTVYVSIRVTVNHSKWADIKDSVLHDVSYVAFPHKGSACDNPHFHIFVPSAGGNCDRERLRKRIRDKLGLTGNSAFSCKLESNGMLNAIRYGSKEGTDAYVSGSDMQALVDMAPPWDPNLRSERNIGGYMKSKPIGREPNPDHYKLITPRNIEKVCLRYRKNNGIVSKDLEDTLAAMHADNWRLAECFYRTGILSVYFDSFTAACEDKHYHTPFRFLSLRREHYDHKQGL